jgi:hypothetical protein
MEMVRRFRHCVGASGSSSVLQYLGEGVFEGRGGAILQYPFKPRRNVWDAQADYS